ncbi:hypothetical protein WJM97_22240 [Okeanomitos corallinicola TIOX110]|uniref:Uncharacterized protein n=1 Tax=Okeanomitos corallinicola TIOX110 TaxID=3133117 RepID=A0ABZ2UUI2_9CYAN
MPRLPRISSREAIRALERLGFGEVSDKPIPLTLQNGSIPIDDHYCYQQSHHYLLAQIKEDGTKYGQLEKQASGIFRHIVSQHPEGQLIVKGIFPPSDELLLW